MTIKANRRTFLKLLSTTLGASATGAPAGCSPVAPGEEELVASNAEALTPTLTIDALRADDLVSLRFDFTNMQLDAAGTKVTRTTAGTPSYLRVVFPSQHITEPLADPVYWPTPPIASRISGRSRVVFRVPDAVNSLDYRLDALLAACTTWDVCVSPNATPPALPPPPPPAPAGGASAFLTYARLQQALATSGDAGALPPSPPRVSLSPPGDGETSIELPYRLVLSPNGYARWAHAASPVTSSITGQTELWHSRLGVRAGDGTVDEKSSALRTVRALWTRDLDQSTQPFSQALTDANRKAIVVNSADPALPLPAYGLPAPLAPPLPIQVGRLMLSALGGYLDARGDWPGAPSNLIAWSHRATGGRDQEVVAVDTGHLLPFGHEAIRVDTTKRVLLGGVAALVKQTQIYVIQPVRTFQTEAQNTTNADKRRRMPFVSVECLETATPVVTCPVGGGFATNLDGSACVIATRAVDRRGREARFAQQVCWIPANTDPGTFNQSPPTYDLRGQRVAFADAADDTTTFGADRMVFGVQKVGADLLPTLDTADVVVDAIRHLDPAANDTATFAYHAAYTQGGLDSAGNKGQMLLQKKIEDARTLVLDFASKADDAGALLAPALKVEGLSAAIGVVSTAATDPASITSALGAVAGGAFNPLDFFSGLPKLFGAVKLTELIPAGAIEKAPKFMSQAVDQVEHMVSEVTDLKKHLDEYKDLAVAKAGALAADIQAQIDLATKAVTDILGDVSTLDSTTVTSLTHHIGALGAAVAALLGIFHLPTGPADGLSRDLVRRLDQISDVTAAVADITGAIAMAQQGLELAKNLHLKLDWRPDLSAVGGDAARFLRVKPDSLLLSVDVRAKAQGTAKKGVDVFCSLDDFSLLLVGSAALQVQPGHAVLGNSADKPAVSLHFAHFQFRKAPQKKPDVDVLLRGIEFGGPLDFVNTLRKLIPLDGFSDPPNLSITPAGLVASFTASLPNIAVGIFALENMKLSASLAVPFLGDTPVSFKFAFCSPEHPFLVTLGFLGGGGYFNVELSPNGGIVALDAALEFGGHLSLDIGVASGSVSLMAGIHFHVEGGDVALAGFVRLRGEVEVLGVVSVSIELYMELGYESATNEVVGRAELTVEVDIACFSESVHLSCEKRFAGPGGPSGNAPLLGAAVTPSTHSLSWNEYWLAFAA